ncbi:MAG: MOSC N-terminal beta barrel domain-containing protein, partial [Pseudomonadota bacterium]
MNVTHLTTFPVKSGRGVTHDRIAVEHLGLAGDRRWVIVDAENHFLTQRTLPGLATLEADITPDGLTIRVDDGEPFAVARPDGSDRVNAMVWRDVIFAALADNAANERL